MHGAPYDFQKSPLELGDYFENLTRLVESTYNENGKIPVVVIGHNMGGIIGLYWLQRLKASWKSRYIKSFVTLGTPWIGAVKPVRLVVSGDNINLYIVNPLMLKTHELSAVLFN